jgi:hypothetical protein
MNRRESIGRLNQRLAVSIIGQEAMAGRLLPGRLAYGNLLTEGLPGFRWRGVTVSCSCLFPLSLRERAG